MKKISEQELRKLFDKYFNDQNRQRQEVGDGCIYAPGNYIIKTIDFEKQIINYIFEQYKGPTHPTEGYYFTNQIGFSDLKAKVANMGKIPQIKFEE